MQDLFGEAPKPLEVHEHSFIRGPRASRCEHVVHSHEGGDQPHQHPDTGPADYTIDKDAWHAATGGAVGGSRKRFTKGPEGEQFPVVELEDWQKTFEVHYTARPNPFKGVTGGGDSAAARMVLAFRMTPVIVEDDAPSREAANG